MDHIHEIRLAAVASCVPPKNVPNSAFESQFGEKAMRRFGKSTGILRRRIATDSSALDLSVAAAEALANAGHDLTQMEAVIFVSQTPEYVLPCSAAIAQHRLGLPQSVAAFDINLGCSGYVYGLMVAAKMLAGRTGGKILLLVGDTISKLCDPADRATMPIFGDAGSATIIEHTSGGSEWSFAMNTDGSGSDAIIVPGSGCSTKPIDYDERGWIDGKLNMDGASVFNFATTRVPEMINLGIAEKGWRPNEVDWLFLHQANSLILKTIARKVDIEPENVPSCLEDFGNTSCASIPLAITQNASRELGKTVLCGFGVGLSWAALFADLGATELHHIEYSA